MYILILNFTIILTFLFSLSGALYKTDPVQEKQDILLFFLLFKFCCSNKKHVFAYLLYFSHLWLYLYTVILVGKLNLDGKTHIMKNKTLIFNSFCKINNSHSLTHSLVKSLRKFLLVADLIVDGCNTYRQSQCSPQNNSNSQPEYTRFYQPVSTTLTLLPAIRSSLSGSYPLTCLAW